MSGFYGELTLEQVAQYPRPGMNVPGRWGFTPDGKSVTYLFSPGGTLVRGLWARDIASGEERLLAGPPPASVNEDTLTREEELRRERARLRELGVTDYQWAKSSDRPLLLVPSGGGLQVSVDGNPLLTLPGSHGAIAPRLSADGSQVAFVRNGDLFVASVVNGEPLRITFGGDEAFTHGLAEFVAQEELDREDGLWWNPAGTHIAYTEADSRHIPAFAIAHTGSPEPETEAHRYPFAGAPNAKLRLGVIPVLGGETTWMDLGSDPDIYVARVAWRPDGALTAQLLSRDQRQLRLVLFDGAGNASTLTDERREPWINLDHGPRYLDAGGFISTSERTGFRHIYMHSADGWESRVLTSGDWVVTRIVDVDEPSRTVYFQGTREGVIERHIYAVSLEGGEIRRLTTENGWHDAVFSRDHTRFIDIHSSTGHAPVVTLHEASGSKIITLFANDGNSAAVLGLQPPRFVTLPASDGTSLHGAIYEPILLSPDERCSIIVSVYGGPHAQRVTDDWSQTVDLRAQYLSQQGFVVFKLDNRGSANRGIAFEAYLNRAMGSVEIDDQVAGVRYLESLNFTRKGGVGIYGWSYGGYMTAMAMLKAPDVFTVGVAGAPVTDWDGYDTGYTERYMGTPQADAEAYRESSVLTHAGNLRGNLLLVHGLIDENVHFRHTARLIAALTAHQKEYDLLVFPEERHMPRDAKGLEYMERRLTDYFDKHLRGTLR
jgi:dipeptidyl-peptidase-4